MMSYEVPGSEGSFLLPQVNILASGKGSLLGKQSIRGGGGGVVIRALQISRHLSCIYLILTPLIVPQKKKVLLTAPSPTTATHRPITQSPHLQLPHNSRLPVTHVSHF